jgi:lycopene cyclase domain-containing protein
MEKYLYLLVNLFTILIPFIFTFSRDVKFYSKLKYFLPAMFATMAFFIVWDILKTKWGIWGFNPRYLTGINIVNLPLEEWLFFISVPYACVFSYEALNYHIKKDFFAGIAKPLSWVLIVVLLFVAVFNLTKIYTSVTFILLAVFLLVLMLFVRPTYLSRAYFAYTILLVPFLIVNGILTGTFTPEPIVWYDDTQNLAIRIMTIPVEDVFYGLLLILMNITLYEKLKTSAAK